MIPTAVPAQTWFIGIGSQNPSQLHQIAKYTVNTVMTMKIAIPIKYVQDSHFCLKEKFDQYSALIKVRQMYGGKMAMIRHNLSTLQNEGCSKTLLIGIKQIKLPKAQATTGPLKIDRQYNFEVVDSSPNVCKQVYWLLYFVLQTILLFR